MQQQKKRKTYLILVINFPKSSVQKRSLWTFLMRLMGKYIKRMSITYYKYNIFRFYSQKILSLYDKFSLILNQCIKLFKIHHLKWDFSNQKWSSLLKCPYSEFFSVRIFRNRTFFYITHNNLKSTITWLKHTKTRSMQNGVCLVELRIYSNLLIHVS